MDNKMIRWQGLYSFLVLNLLSLAGLFSSLPAQTKVGTTAVPFLGVSVGPRATAMGGAFAAVATDASALYYNPGGIAQLPTSQIQFVHTNWLVDSKLNWFGFVLNLDGTNAIGISYTQLGYGEEQVTTVLQPEGTGEIWQASDLAVGLSYARRLTDRFSIGGSGKYIQQKLWNESASAFALDVGLLFVTPFKDMRLGMSISNFGSDIRHDGRDLLQRVDLDPNSLGDNQNIVANLKTESWPLPLFFRVGVALDAIKAPHYRLTVAADALRPSDNDEIINVGAEFAFSELAFFRAGYKSLFREDSEEGPTFGVGVKYKVGGIGYHCDYTFADFGLFENIQMFSLGISF